jgi:hypothetical protein
MAKRVALDNGRIMALSLRPEVIKEFPFFTFKLDQAGCCGKKIKQRPNYDAIKNFVKNLPPDGRTRLKELLKVDQITVYYKVGRQTHAELI